MDDNTIFKYDAPQYVDFLQDQSDEHVEFLESYFDVDHEMKKFNIDEGVEIQEIDETLVIQGPTYNNEQPIYELISSPECSEYGTPFDKYPQENKRKSMSVDNIYNMLLLASECEDNIVVKEEPINNNAPLSKVRSCNKNNSNFKKTNANLVKKKFGSTNDISKKDKQDEKPIVKYVSMAESIRKYQLSTPIRFRSKPIAAIPKHQEFKLTFTQAESPKLQTKTRHRPRSVPTREEVENKEIEEMKMHQVKAHPVNKKVLQEPPHLPSVAKKTPTKVIPFKFPNDPVKIKNIQPLLPNPVVKFHAKPVPKAVKGPMKPLPVVTKLPNTVAMTPKFSTRFGQKGKCKSIDNISVKSESSTNSSTISNKPLTRTQVQPFSFEARHQQMIRKKEEKIKELLEQEKKAREFHANPLPKAKKPPTPVKATLLVKRRSRSASRPVNKENEEPYVFKAKPATVVYKQPFIPVKPDRHLVDVTEFNLNSDRRAQERAEFELKQKEKEEQLEKIKALREIEIKKKEIELIKQMRKEAVHKAQPIRKFKEIEPVERIPPTVPMSPAFICGKLHHGRELNH